MSIRISDDFFLVTYPEMPEYKIQTLILDTNCVGAIYKWATDSKDVPTEKIRPILDLIRSGKSIEIVYGAMESSWTFEKGALVTRENFDLAKLSDFRYKVIAIDTIKKSTNKQFETWIKSTGRRSIAFLPAEETRLQNFTDSEAEYRSLLQATAQEWVLFLMLFKYLAPLWDSQSFEERLDGFKNWNHEIMEKRIARSTVVTTMAIIGFFGGEIQESYFVRGLKDRQRGKLFNRDLMLKKQEWSEYGLSRVARNLAMDAVHIRERNKFQSGLMQSPYGLERASFPRENTAIVTGDRAMNAFHGLIKSAIPITGKLQPDAFLMDFPEGSEIVKLKKQDAIQDVLGIHARNSKDLLIADDLLEIAFDIMDEFKAN